ncbi:MAG: hypothetical protein R2941_07790 [Desulfobacterales bacterium]
MSDEDKNAAEERDSIFGEIVIYSVLIFVLLTFLLWVINRLELEKKTASPSAGLSVMEKEAEKNVLSDFPGIQNPKTEFSEDKTEEPALSAGPVTLDWHIRDLEKIIQDFENIESKISDYLKNHTADLSESDRALIHEELEKLRKDMDSHPERISEKLDRIISLIEKQNKGKELQAVTPVKAKIRPPEAGKKTAEETGTEEKAQVSADTGKEKTLIAQKPAEPDPVKKKETPVPEPVSQKAEMFEKTPGEEEKTPAFPIPDNILTGQEVSALHRMEHGGISAKTLCRNRQNTVHFLSSQLLVRLVDIHPPDDPGSAGRAVIDVTHPRLGLRRFSEMEEGTTRPFEYGSRVFFLELLKLYPNCADVAVYERKNS